MAIGKNQKIEVFILCGGFGTRLQSIAINGPKPMAPIGDRPFLDHIFFYLAHFGFTSFCFLTGHKGEVVRDYFTTEKFKNYKIRFSHEDTPLGTGGAIKKAIESSNLTQFLVLNGDTFFGINYNEFLAPKYPEVNRVALITVSDASRYGTVKINSQFYVENFIEKATTKSDAKKETLSNLGPSLINGGIYLLNKEVLNFFAGETFSLENEIFPKLVDAKKLVGIPLPGRFIDIGIPEDYYLACEQLPNWINDTYHEIGS